MNRKIQFLSLILLFTFSFLGHTPAQKKVSEDYSIHNTSSDNQLPQFVLPSLSNANNFLSPEGLRPNVFNRVESNSSRPIFYFLFSFADLLTHKESLFYITYFKLGLLHNHHSPKIFLLNQQFII